jgi:FAD/FMN-containing dehydrogenase
MNVPAALAEWQALLGSANVLSADDAQRQYGADTSGLERRIAGALKVQLAGEVAPAMRAACRHRVAVYPVSTGRNWGYGSALPVEHDCVILDMSALRRILHFDAELGVVTVEPGVTQGQLAEFLAAGRHPFMVPVTGAGPNCSLLGNALERGYGITPHGDHFGAVTDIEAVLADGSLHRSTLRDAAGEDLARLFKWGLGPYAAGLFTQSGLGVVTQISIVLARRPPCVKACLFSLRSDSLLEPAVERVRALLSALPGSVGAVNLMNRHRVLAMTAPYPAQQLGPDGLIPQAVLQRMGRDYQVQPWTGFATLYGTERSVRAAQHEIRQALRGVASRMFFVDAGRAALLARAACWLPGTTGQRLLGSARTLAQALELAAGRPNETALPLAYWLNRRPAACSPRDPARDGCGLIWYAPLVPMRPAGVRAYVEMVQRVTRQHAVEPLITLTSINDRLFDSTVPLLFDRDATPAVERTQQCFAELLRQGATVGVYPYRLGLLGLQAQGRGQDPDAASSASLYERIRAALDPNDILAPGRYARPMPRCGPAG